VLALKSNQDTRRDDVEAFFVKQRANGYKDCQPSRHQTLEKNHGRIETRIVTAICNVAWLQERHKWPGLSRAPLVVVRTLGPVVS
jgi:hypothetical protein